MAKLLLNRQAGAIAGISIGSGVTSVTTRGDGVSLVQNATLATLRSFPLGSGSADFGGAAIVCEASARIAVVLSDSRTKEQVLVTRASDSAAEGTLADVSPRIPVPGKSHSLHMLKSTISQTAADHAECLAIVLQHGQVAWMEASSQALQMQLCPHPSNSKPKAASAMHDTLGVLSQSTSGAAAHVQLFKWTEGTLSATRMLTATCPSTSASASQLYLASSYAMVVWSNGTISILRGMQGDAEQPQINVSCADLTGAVANSAHPSDVAAPSSQGKKRKPGQGQGDNLQPGVLPMVSPYDDSQFIMASVVPGSASAHGSTTSTEPGLQYALVDSKFGCTISRGHVPLDPAMITAAASAASTQFNITTNPAAPGLVILQLGGAVLGIRLEAPAASLLSLVGRMAVSAAEADMPASAGATCSISLPHLSGQAVATSTAYRHHAGVLLPAPGASVVRHGCSDEEAMLVAELDRDLPSQPSDRDKLLQRALQHVLASQHAGAGSSGRGGGALAPPPTRLMTALAQQLAAAGQWDGLQQLLAGVSLQGLQCCSQLLAAAAQAQQYRLLAPLCCKLDEVQPRDVAAALAVLLGPTTASNLAGRRGYYQHLRAHAEAAITQSEAQIRSHRAQDRKDAVAFAHCAAAAVDQFSYQEVLLHPLLAVPMDAPALQDCLARLSNSQVDRLLAYLARWMDKYTQKLGDGAASVPLPQELLFPTFTQVLEWVRVVIDAHLARLLMGKQPLQHMTKLLNSLKLQVSACQHLLPLLGTAEHIRHQAPLPAAHVAAATQYTVELLDLGIRTR